MAEWFAPKLYGFGSGRPTAWQGWALTIGYIAAMIAASLLAERSPWAAGSVIVTITALFLIIASRTTPGGWKWRWGKKD